jgi:protein-tyrosine-phosphatase/DNA-binding transcriptional ArsR family regulator
VREPPPLVRLAAHPIRWSLLRELGQSDRAVWELTELVDEPQNLVSYHLRQLREGGLVLARRSAADARDTYYAIDLAACRRELQAAGAGLHPSLSLAPFAREMPRPPAIGGKQRVLFLCTGNSSRSQMAQALLERMCDGAIEVASAGSHPKPLHPKAVRVMQRRGIDISGNRTKHFDEYAGQRFDMVITLCDRVREVCPEFPADPDLVHWSIPDPALDGTMKAFENTAVELETRIGYLLPLLTGRRSTHAQR